MYASIPFLESDHDGADSEYYPRCPSPKLLAVDLTKRRQQPPAHLLFTAFPDLEPRESDTTPPKMSITARSWSFKHP